MKHSIKYSVLVILIVLAANFGNVVYGDNGIGYFPPKPKDIKVLVSKPSITMQLVLNNNTIEAIEMRLNGNKVDAKYEKESQRIVYLPNKPLSPGQYKVDLSINLTGWKPITHSWQFTVSENAVEQLSAPTEEQKQVRNYANRYRQFLGLKEFTLNKSLNSAAMAHSNYMAINKKTTHDEFINDKGFVGTKAYNRVSVFGYVESEISENVSSGQSNYQESIDGLMDAPYHRLSWLNPFFTELGYGVKDKYYTFNFGGSRKGADKIVVYPVDGQQNVPVSWNGNETPNPLRIHNKTGTVGYPISLSYFTEKTIEKVFVEKVNVANSRGYNTPIYLNTPQRDAHLQDSILIIPSRPLTKNETYKVIVKGKILFEDKSEQRIDKTWKFTTIASEENKNAWMKDMLYEDIDKHWAKNDILELGKKQIVSPKSGKLYKPDDKVTRAEFTEFIVNALGIQTKAYEGIFKDVNQHTNKAVYIEAAYRAGLVKGVGDYHFAPSRSITREEMAVLIMKAYTEKGNMENIRRLGLLSFLDNKDVSSWATKDVKAVYKLGIMRGREEGKFSPKDDASRAEAAVVIKKLLEKISS
ncbi:S-layer homology domain-containing protein [Clostridiaceae bacterium 35-E11]